MATNARRHRHGLARRVGVHGSLIGVYIATLVGGWALGGEIGLLVAMLVVIVVEARLADHRYDRADPQSAPLRTRHSWSTPPVILEVPEPSDVAIGRTGASALGDDPDVHGRAGVRGADRRTTQSIKSSS